VTLHFEAARREAIPLLIGLAGPSGSGKTYSALRLATGLAAGKPIAFIDTERGRALHYADEFTFLHAELDAPFAPARYAAALEAAHELDPGVIIVDSFSHEWAGEGGVLDMQQAEYERLGSREAAKFASWIKPKAEHKALVNDVLLRLPCHLILCLRAEEKVELVKNEAGKLEVVPKRTLAGHVGWIPVTGKEIPYELTISLVVTPDQPGVPKPIKLQTQHRPLVPLDQPLSEEVGRGLAEWARGSSSGAEPGPSHGTAGAGLSEDEPAPSAPDPSVSELRAELESLVTALGATEALPKIAAKAAAGDAAWLRRQIATARKTLAQREEQGEFSFADKVPRSVRL
jgi:hypothetical protein